MRGLLATDHGRELYRQRRQVIEPVFGHTKHNRKFIQVSPTRPRRRAHRVAITDDDAQPHQALPPPNSYSRALNGAPPASASRPGPKPPHAPRSARPPLKITRPLRQRPGPGRRAPLRREITGVFHISVPAGPPATFAGGKSPASFTSASRQCRSVIDTIRCRLGTARTTPSRRLGSCPQGRRPAPRAGVELGARRWFVALVRLGSKRERSAAAFDGHRSDDVSARASLAASRSRTRTCSISRRRKRSGSPATYERQSSRPAE